MRKIQTHVAIIATVLVLLALLILGAYAVLAEGAKPTIFILLAPITALTIALAFILGKKLARPLDEAQERMRAWLAERSDPGSSVNAAHRSGSQEPSGGNGQKQGMFRESRLFSQEVNTLIELDESQRQHLELLEGRQMEFVRDVAHELRTPLTAIHGDAEVLMDPDLPPELHQKFCENIIRESERLSRLTVDLTTLINAEEGDFRDRLQPADLHEIAEMAVGSLSPILRDHGVHVTITGEAPQVMCDPDKMEEVVSNLVDNANRFVEQDGRIDIVLGSDGRYATLDVLDDGTGFGDIDPRLLFERFYRTDFSRSRNRGGSGLGLAIVKGIVEAYGGTVQAANRPEGGARFTVRIPAATQQEQDS